MTARALPIALSVALVAAACSSGNGHGSSSAATSFDGARAWSHLERIVALGPRPSGSEANARLRDLLVAELEALGLAPVREAFTAATPEGELAFENVYADLPATLAVEGEPRSILLATHFDTKRSSLDDSGPIVGANDGGSGTAVLLELARHLVADKRLRPTGLRLLFLDGEEATRLHWEGDDNTYGSRHHAQALKASGAHRGFGAMVLLDMVGDRDLRLLHETYSRRELMELFEQHAIAVGLGAHVDPRRALPIKDDHLSFLAVGIPSVDLIDFDYGPANAWWHTADDTLDKCSARSLEIAGAIVLAGLPALETWVLDRR